MDVGDHVGNALMVPPVMSMDNAHVNPNARENNVDLMVVGGYVVYAKSLRYALGVFVSASHNVVARNVVLMGVVGHVANVLMGGSV